MWGRVWSFPQLLGFPYCLIGTRHLEVPQDMFRNVSLTYEENSICGVSTPACSRSSTQQPSFLKCRKCLMRRYYMPDTTKGAEGTMMSEHICP